MTCEDSETILNDALIQMSRSFLQYVGESSPWVNVQSCDIPDQISALAARQRQDVAQIATVLNDREHSIDFGSFPTEYTDQQFLSLKSLAARLTRSQQLICDRLRNSVTSLRNADDSEGTESLRRIESFEREILRALEEIECQLSKTEKVA